MCSAPQEIMPRPSSTTKKSRMFSQTSPKERGRSVPSPEYSQMSEWIGCASASIALRVRNGGLLTLSLLLRLKLILELLLKLMDTGSCSGERLAYLSKRSSPGQIVFFN